MTHPDPMPATPPATPSPAAPPPITPAAPDAAFKPGWWVRGGHAQTLWPTLARRVRLRTRTEILELPDGDFLRLDWVGHRGPTVVVLPGLQGSLKSSYVRGLLAACERRGWRAVLLHYRGCGTPNRLRSAYHCGMSDDLHHVVQLLHDRDPHAPLAVVGYSVGANIGMKWLGEAGHRGEQLPLAAAVGVSVPFHLGEVAQEVTRGFSRLYQWYLLRSLRRDVAAKMAARDLGLDLTPADLRKLTNFDRFDSRVTAPLHGFAGAQDYYDQTQSAPWLRHIQVPTLIINALNDPLVPPRLLPTPADLSPHVTLQVTECGGHLGFVTGRWPWRPQYWLEDRITDYLDEAFGCRTRRRD